MNAITIYHFLALAVPLPLFEPQGYSSIGPSSIGAVIKQQVSCNLKSGSRRVQRKDKASTKKHTLPWRSQESVWACENTLCYHALWKPAHETSEKLNIFLGRITSQKNSINLHNTYWYGRLATDSLSGLLAEWKRSTAIFERWRKPSAILFYSYMSSALSSALLPRSQF